ncbi:MAG: efflux RND transporter periplasmic adaptor subunit [Thermoanaerobaculia bacterium]|nr:efflux RND transporter periplasmic adaptor subunit [Thermoanaerobaculia bacterium]
MATTDRRAPDRRAPLRRARLAAVAVPGAVGAMAAFALLLAGCGHRHETLEAETASWQVTAWGERYELFPEVDPLIAGAAAPAHTHVTVLDGFSPLTEGRVEIVLRNESGEQAFDATTPVRPGIYNIDVAPSAPGEYELSFRIDSAAGFEEIRGGAVRVGGAADPGGIVRAPAPRGATEASEPVPFLKEQQWRTAFATDWVRRGALPEGARGLGRVRPPAGGDVTLTASLDGVLQSTPWPYPGQEVAAGATLFRVVPRTASEQSLAGLGAAVAGLEAEEAAARARAARLEELLVREATSRREVEAARALATSLAARLDAARRDLDAESAARAGRGSAEASVVRAPFAGRVATVTASPGAAVAAGEPLGRVVRSGKVWFELDLAPAAARALAAQGASGLVVEPRDAAPIRLGTAAVRLVSIAPEVDPAKGTVAALLELDAPALVLGTTLQAEVLLGGEREGIVVPASAVVDDGGVAVVYLQLSGESFARQEVHVVARQGDRVLVDGLVPGQRLVTRGGEAIRRASLMSSGEAHGHVH